MNATGVWRSLLPPPIWGLGEGLDLGSVLGEWLGWEANREALDELGHAAGVHLEREALAELPELLGVGLGDAAEVDELPGGPRSRPGPPLAVRRSQPDCCSRP